ncbi:hypothetical protein ACFVAV_22520 [Nocardia sp. NPDC057663]|uniref:hypothetical protein n=1 Tax=Nocardia sp. NPDC057663 TaxID=3346201 RepID=UPI00366DED94
MTEADETPIQVDTVDGLVDIAELVDIVFFEVAGKRTTSSSQTEANGSTDIDISVRTTSTGIDVRCLCRVIGGGGEYVCDAAARYDFGRSITISDSVLPEFVQRVGVMAVYPYLREAITASAAKLRLTPPLLRLLRPGDVHAAPKAPPL